MVLGKQQCRQFLDRHAAEFGQLSLQGGLEVKLFFQPHRHGGDKGAKTSRRIGQVGLQQALELDQWLVVEHHFIDIRQGDATLGQAAVDGAFRKTGIVLLAGEAFFLRGGDNDTVTHQGGGTVMVVRGET